jgi:chromosome segregation protein
LPEGASAWALDVVTVDSKFAGLMERLLSQVLIVPDRNTALKLRKDYPDLSFVSRNGEVLTPEGVIRGGSSGGKDSSLLKRRNEIEMLVIEVKKLANEEKVAEQEILDCETRTKELREELEQAKDRLQRHRVEDSTFQGQLKLAKREADTIESKVANNKWEREELGSREKTATDSRSALENELTRARERLTALEEDARKFSVRVEEAIKRENEAREQLSEARTALAVEKQARDSAAREQDPMSRRIRELAELNDRRKSEISAARERITKGDGENEELDVEMESYRSEVASLKDELSHADEQRKGFARGIEEAEAGFSEVRSKQNKVLNQISKEEVACTKLDLRLENLVESTMERHQVDLAHFRPDAHILITCINDRKEAEKKGRSRKISEVDSQVNGEEVADEGAEVIAKTNSDEEVDEAVIEILEGEGPDWAFVEAIVADLKRRLDSMGPVNLDAIEEFDELEERHNFTRNQHDDLVNSKEKLLEIIERINIESERLFAETFHAVSKNFKSMFKRLFGDKATADLILQDESDPLECGIEVIAKPPGKKLQSISLMSGGERSMTAVALLFSIYMVKPSPFCVLDELDAPLDESNIGRFLKVLDAFIDQSQFIIVTHSKRTMERADVMYGVTMEEFGVSKPVGMRLTNGVEKPGDAKSSAQKAALRLNS